MIAPAAGQQAHIRECLWCQTVILATRRQRGSPPKFCSPSHRLAFWAALRRRALTDFEAGVLTLAMLKRGEQSVHALSGQVQTRSLAEGASS
jgi:hypothetical protein